MFAQFLLNNWGRPSLWKQDEPHRDPKGAHNVEVFPMTAMPKTPTARTHVGIVLRIRWYQNLCAQILLSSDCYMCSFIQLVLYPVYLGTIFVLSHGHRMDHVARHPLNAGLERIELSPTKPTSRSPSADLSEMFGEPHDGWAPSY